MAGSETYVPPGGRAMKRSIGVQAVTGKRASPRRGSRIRVWTALVLLFAFAFISNGQLLRRALRQGLPRPGTDEISRLDQRFAAVRPYASARGVIGLVVEPGSERAKSGQSFFMAQYALAPLVVVQRTDCEWVVVDGNDDGSAPAWDGRGDFVLVAGKSNDVKLFRRVSK